MADADEHLSVADFRRRREDSARERLAEAVPEAVAAYCKVSTMVSSGKPSREILRVAAERHSDLIVIGIRGRDVADLLFFGSTTQHVVRHAACPVLTQCLG
jgi:nucleotide-binding universal stress UspA family protein